MSGDSGWIGVDLDGTLAEYDHWKGPACIGAPIPRMVERVRSWLEAGKEVRVLTARVCSTQPPGIAELARAAIELWCERHLGRRLEVTAEKDWRMTRLWDDRVVQVIPNTGQRADEAEACRMDDVVYDRVVAHLR